GWSGLRGALRQRKALPQSWRGSGCSGQLAPQRDAVLRQWAAHLAEYYLDPAAIWRPQHTLHQFVRRLEGLHGAWQFRSVSRRLSRALRDRPISLTGRWHAI